MSASNANVSGGQTLSLPEREIAYMLQSGLRWSGVNDLWKSQNYSPKSDGPPAKRGEGRKVPWLVELRTFCLDASVVGLRYVANASASPFRRSIWAVLLIAGAAFTAYQIQDRIRCYFSYPVTLNYRVEHKEEMRFPTVTICNENRISRKAADALGNSFIHCLNALQHI